LQPIYGIEESSCDTVRTFGARNDWPPGETVPLALPRYAPVTNQELL